VSAGWVAGSVRGKLLTRRRLGAAGARRVAASGGTDAAVGLLARSPYGRDVHDGSSADEARRAVGAGCLWHLRVLAGWLPPTGGELVRVFAAPFELANIADRLAGFAGAEVPPPFPMGGLAVAWPRAATAATATELRAALAASAWGDPGTTAWPEASIALTARWASWLADAVPGAGAWSAGAAALLAARLLAVGSQVPPAAGRDLRRQLGDGWESAASLIDLRGRVPRSAAWALADVVGPDDLWGAEGRWWQRVDRDAATTLRAARPGPEAAAAAAARLAADAWRAQAALEAAAWGPAGVEVFDALA